MSTRPTTADYRTLIESAPEAIIVYTPEKFLFVNSFAAKRLVADRESLVGHPIMEFVHPKSVPLVIERIRQLARGEKGGDPAEIHFVARDDTVIPAEMVSVPITFGGQKAFLGLIRDISKRVEMERALRESEQERAISERRAGRLETAIAVAHEMNNALTALMMNAELLSTDASPEEVPEITSAILSASQKIAATVQRLQQLGEPESVEYLGEKKMVDLSARPTPKPRKKGK
ncbi:MAG TPA: PAS domain S-box protein [Gemmatimonadaceae bacterium]|nr:PAS domain S-box protein [Gemmatimonadaceae bacterium]